MIAKAINNNRAPLEPDIYNAICFGLIDLGTQTNERFGGSAHKIMILWELPDVEPVEYKLEDGTYETFSRVISKEYTLSLNDKASLRRDLIGWRGKEFTAEELQGFELKKILGVQCRLDVRLNAAGTFERVSNVIKKSKTALECTRELIYFSFEEGSKIPELTPAWIVAKIQKAKEWTGDIQELLEE